MLASASRFAGSPAWYGLVRVNPGCRMALKSFLFSKNVNFLQPGLIFFNFLLNGVGCDGVLSCYLHVPWFHREQSCPAFFCCFGPIKRPDGTRSVPALNPAMNRRATFGRPSGTCRGRVGPALLRKAVNLGTTKRDFAWWMRAQRLVHARSVTHVSQRCLGEVRGNAKLRLGLSKARFHRIVKPCRMNPAKSSISWTPRPSRPTSSSPS